MAGTRSSARLANKTSPKQDEPTTGTKRKAEQTSPARSKRGRKAAPKEQQTIEESFANGQEEQNKDTEKSENVSNRRDSASPGKDESANAESKQSVAESKAGSEKKTEEKESADATKGEDAKTEADEPKEESGTTAEKSTGAIEKSAEREKKIPSNILEKGLIYFFTRNRVGVEEAESVNDLQRTYFVLRPLPVGAKLGEGPIPDLNNNRLFALPKKTLPKSHSDRFMSFVERTNVSIADLKENFFQGSEYETKTMGTRKVEPVTPIGEGIYAITQSEDTSTHLVYMLTIPSELGDVQQDLGLRTQGSFHISVKNPERPGPASARLPKGPEYPKEFLEEFRGLAWANVQPKYLDFENSQILLIGEGTEQDLGKAVEQTRKNEKQDKDAPKEELEKLEHEDEVRVKRLSGDDSVFDDLRISREEYSRVPTTW